MRVIFEKIASLFSGTNFLVSRYGGGIRGVKKAFAEAVSVLVKKGPRQVLRQVVNNINASRYAGTDTSRIHLSGGSIKRFHTQKVEPHKHSAEIVVCVHNALDDVKRCLASVVRYTLPPYRLILVDDGSLEETKEYLSNFSKNQNAILIRNDKAQGYTLAANKGLRATQDKFVILLNSDTIVSEGWLDRMIQCAESSEKIGMVGPLSNTASWQSVPEMLVDGDWATNPLPSGLSIAGMASLVARHSKRVYPRLSFLNGFCIMIKRELIDDIGIFDEETFGQGFCEENDYCLRASLKGWELAVADDVYIYHAQSKSYTNERRLKLAAESDRKFVEKFNQQIISSGVDQCRFDHSMISIRAHIKQLYDLERLLEKGQKLWEGKTIAILLPVLNSTGGANVVISEALAIQQMGVSVTIVNTTRNQLIFEKVYAYSGLDFLYVDDSATVADLLKDFDAVIATTFRSVQWLQPFIKSEKTPILGYYIQDFEPYFYDPDQDADLFHEATRSYTLIPNIRRLTKTKWNQEQLKAQLNLECFGIGLSYNSDIFRPTPCLEKNQLERPIKIVAMIRPETPRRAPELTLRVLCQCKEKYGDKIELITFGCEKGHPIWCSVPENVHIEKRPTIPNVAVSDLFNEADIFVDFSTFQAMGLSALEAMACGVAVIVPQEGGAREFARHEVNSLLVDTKSEKDCLSSLERLIRDRVLRKKIQQQAISDVVSYSSIRCGYNILNVLFSEYSQ